MQQGAHRSDDGGINRVGLMRGILVIVTAVAIGAFVLSRGLDDSTVEAVATNGDEAAANGATTDDSTTTTTTTATTAPVGGAAVETSTTVAGDQTTTEPTTSTTSAPAAPEIRAPADVPVLVLNAAGTKGVAGRGAEVLQTAGYPVLAPKNATVLGATAVLYVEGFEAEAQSVAAVFGLDPVAVVAAYDPAAPPIDDIREAIVIVVIGKDGLIDV